MLLCVKSKNSLSNSVTLGLSLFFFSALFFLPYFATLLSSAYIFKIAMSLWIGMSLFLVIFSALKYTDTSTVLPFFH